MRLRFDSNNSHLPCSGWDQKGQSTSTVSVFTGLSRSHVVHTVWHSIHSMRAHLGSSTSTTLTLESRYISDYNRYFQILLRVNPSDILSTPLTLWHSNHPKTIDSCLMLKKKHTGHSHHPMPSATLIILKDCLEVIGHLQASMRLSPVQICHHPMSSVNRPYNTQTQPITLSQRSDELPPPSRERVNIGYILRSTLHYQTRPT